MGTPHRRPPTHAWVGMLVGAAVLATVGCSKTTAPEAAPPEVLVADVVQRDVPVYGEWVGTIDGFVNAQIRAKVQGYLMARTYDEGSLVKAGQQLFQLDPRQYKAALDQAKAEVAQAQANHLRDQQNVARYRPLVEKGAISRKQLEDTIQQMLADAAAVEAAKATLENAQLNFEWTKVNSPIAGIAGIAQAQVGDLIAPTVLMTTVSQLDPVKVYFPISEQEYLKFAERGPDGAEPTGKTSLELFLADGSVYPERGKVSAINRQVEVQTGSLQVQAEFPNPGNVLRPGGYAKIRAVTDLRKNAAVVPQRAVQEVQGSYQVVVVGKDDTVSFRTVTAGPKTGTDWVIDKGLEPGERVVAEGVLKLRDGMKVNPKPFVPPTTIPATNG